MKCHVCGATLHTSVTDLPFKLGDKKIVILKDLPVLQCPNCVEYLFEDAVTSRVDLLLSQVDEAVELEIRRYAA